MATTIITKNGSGAPLAGDLTAGELAVDLTNKRLYSKDSGGTVIELGTNAGSSTFTDLTVTGDLTVDTNTLHVDSTNNRVGIGTNNPQTTFTVKGSVIDTQLEMGNVSGGAFIEAYDRVAGAVGNFILAGNSFTFSRAGTELLNVTSAGKVGINKDPTATLDVDVGSSSTISRFETTNTALARQYIYGGASTTQVDMSLFQGTDLQGVFGIQTNTGNCFIDSRSSVGGDTIFQRTGNEKMRIKENGHVGIGESNPEHLLHAKTNTATVLSSTLSTRFEANRLRIQNSNTTVGSGAGITLQSQAGSNNYWFMDIVGATSYGSPLVFTHRTGSSTVTERFRINGDGKIGVNNSNPLATFAIQGTSSTNSNFEVNCGNSGATVEVINRNDSNVGQTLGFYSRYGSIAFHTGAYTKRGSFDNNGNFMVGQDVAHTNATNCNVHSSLGVAAKGFGTRSGSAGAFTSNLFNIAWSSPNATLYIDSTSMGVISVSSDYRIKRNVETQTENAIDRIKLLRPVTYQMANFQRLFVESDDIKEGFIAHELADVIPSAVEGEKDAPNQIQSLKLDALCSVLTKAIQEQQAMIETLQAQVAELQGAN